MGTNQMAKELMESLEQVVAFYDMNDDGTGEPFMALGFSIDVVKVFQRAKQTLEKAKREIGRG